MLKGAGRAACPFSLRHSAGGEVHLFVLTVHPALDGFIVRQSNTLHADAILAPKVERPSGGHVARIRNPKDFWAGVLFVLTGIAAIVIGSRYNLGTAARMGPGYFPRILGMLLIVLGGILALRALRTNGPAIPAWRWRPTLVVLGSVVLFGLIVNRVGLALSTVILIVLASAASTELRWKEALVSGLLLATLAVGVFIIGLKLQLPIWPTFLHG